VQGTPTAARLIAASDGEALKVTAKALRILLESSAHAVQVVAYAIVRRQGNEGAESAEQGAEAVEKAAAQVLSLVSICTEVGDVVNTGGTDHVTHDRLPPK
jgi:hypothetical protein